MKRLLPYLKHQKLRLFIQIIVKIIGTLMDLAIPYVLTHIIDEVVPVTTKENYTQILWYGLLMVGFSIIGFSFNIIANQSASYIARTVTRGLRHDLFSKIQSLSNTQIDELTMPSIISRLSSDTYNVHQMVGMMQRIGIRAPILLIGGIIVTLTLDVKLTLILLITLPLIVVATIIISKLGIPLFNNVQLSIDNMIRVIRENISGIRVIKALTKMDYEKNRFNKVNKEVMGYELKSGYTMATLSPIINVLLNVGLVAVLVVGAINIKGEETKVGTVMAFTTYFTIILNAMLTITRIFMVFSRSLASLTRISYILDMKEDLKVEDIEPKKSEYFIEFNNVDFSYNKKELNLENINFKLKHGQTLGIIGATGSGKTTIINLLMRFYDIDSGEILINGRNVKSIDAKELKDMFGIAFQNDTIFSDTIKENIVFGRNISDDDLQKAIRVSQAYDFIYNQKEGLETILTPFKRFGFEQIIFIVENSFQGFLMYLYMIFISIISSRGCGYVDKWSNPL